MDRMYTTGLNCQAGYKRFYKTCSFYEYSINLGIVSCYILLLLLAGCIFRTNEWNKLTIVWIKWTHTLSSRIPLIPFLSPSVLSSPISFFPPHFSATLQFIYYFIFSCSSWDLTNVASETTLNACLWWLCIVNRPSLVKAKALLRE